MDIAKVMNLVAEELTYSPTSSTLLHNTSHELINETQTMSTALADPTYTTTTNGQPLPPDPSEVSHSLPAIERNYNRLTTIRLLHHAAHDPYTSDIKLQMNIDGGANRSITNNSNYLLHFRNIKPYSIAGVNATDPGVICTGTYVHNIG